MARFLYDTFTGTNATALTARTGETGATWTKNTAAIYATGVATIQTNRIYLSAGSNAGFYASGVPASPDYDVSVTVNIVSAATCEAGVCGRMSTTADTMYLLDYERTSGGVWQMKLYSNVAGSYTQIGSTFATGTPVVGSDHTVMLRMRGSQISGYYDGALQIGPVTSTTITAPGVVGLRFSTNTSTTTGVHIADVAATDSPPGKNINRAPLIRAALY